MRMGVYRTLHLNCLKRRELWLVGAPTAACSINRSSWSARRRLALFQWTLVALLCGAFALRAAAFGEVATAWSARWCSR